MRLAIFAAFPHELKQILSNLGAFRDSRRYPFRLFFAQYACKEIIVVLTGMGARNAEAALKYTVEEYAPEAIVSIGFGGALYSGSGIGDLVWASKVLLLREGGVITLELPEARQMYGRASDRVLMHEGCILTLERWMKKSELRQVTFSELPFPVCDTETFPLARLSTEKGLPFFAIRSITDRADEEIPRALLDVSDESGMYSLPRALWLLARKPGLIPDSLKLGRNSHRASKNLGEAVKALIEVV